jgi:hypothetical protein
MYTAMPPIAEKRVELATEEDVNYVEAEEGPGVVSRSAELQVALRLRKNRGVALH